MTPNSKTILGISLTILLNLAFAAQAMEPRPAGPVILTVSGAIDKTNGDDVMSYDRNMLETLEMHDLVTETPWTQGAVTFTGVLFRDLLANAGAHGGSIKAIALNDYSVDIPVADLDAYSVILALKKDGDYLSIRDRGPLWVIYPWSSVSALQNDLYYSRSIWQLRAIDVSPN